MAWQSIQWKVGAVLLLALVSSCTVYRTDRTFFEPNAADGIPIKSSSCGFHLNDALARQLPGVYVSVAPFEHEGKPNLSASVLIRTPDRNVTFKPDKFELRSADGKVYQPIEIRTQAYGLDLGHPFWSTFVTLTYAPLAGELSEIAFVFQADSVVVKGNAVDIRPFRFAAQTPSTKSTSYPRLIKWTLRHGERRVVRGGNAGHGQGSADE
jgi:hypothetical protein